MDFIKKVTEKPAEALATFGADAELRARGQVPEEIRPDAKTEAFLVRRQIERQKRAAAAKAASEAAAKEVADKAAFREVVSARRNVARKYLKAKNETAPALNKNLESIGLPWRIKQYDTGNFPADREMVSGGYTGRSSQYLYGGTQQSLPGAMDYATPVYEHLEQGLPKTKAFVSDFKAPGDDPWAAWPIESPGIKGDAYYAISNPHYLDPNAAPDRFKEVAPAKIREGANALKGRVVNKLKKLRGGGGAGGGSAGGGGSMPDVDEVREEEYTQGGPDYAAEDELDKYARLDRAYKGEYTSPESQAQAEKVAQLQADAASEGETVEHEAAETPAQEASEEDGYEEEGEVIPDDDMTAPPQDSPQSLINERAAAIGESLGAGAEEAGAKTETQKLDEYIRQSVKDYYESRGMKYEDLFAKSEPKAKPAAAPARRGPAVQRAETVTTSNGGQRQSDLAREAEYLRGRTEPPPPPPPPKPPVVPKPQATPGPFDADISEALDRSSMRHRPSDTAAIAAAQEAERNPATVGSAVGSQKTAEAVEAMERSNEGMRNAWKSVLPIGGALGGLAYGAYRAKRAADTASEAGKAGAEAFRQALRMGEGQAPVRSGVRVGEGVVEAAARPTRVARSRALPAGSAAPPAAGAAPRSQSQALQRAPVEAEFVPEGPVGALPGGATRRLLPEGHTSASRPATTQVRGQEPAAGALSRGSQRNQEIAGKTRAFEGSNREVAAEQSFRNKFGRSPMEQAERNRKMQSQQKARVESRRNEANNPGSGIPIPAGESKPVNWKVPSGGPRVTASGKVYRADRGPTKSGETAQPKVDAKVNPTKKRGK